MKRYTITIEFYLYANNDKEAKKLAKKFAKKFSEKVKHQHDNEVAIQSIYHTPFGWNSNPRLVLSKTKETGTLRATT